MASAAIEAFSIGIGGQAIAGLRARAADARGLILALHGGGYEARYWHAADGSETSLVWIGAALGYDVVAIDRPGYRGSATPFPAGLPLEAQADLLFALIAELAPDPALPVFLVGHSMGGILAVRMAADPRSSRLAAIDVSGVPLRYPAAMQPIIDRAIGGATNEAGNVPTPDDAGRRWMFYGEDGSFDPAVAAAVKGANRVPAAEMKDAFAAPAVLPPLMARIAIPVQWTIADQERSSEGGATMLEHIRSLMGRCPRLVTSIQIASGHNISLHHVGRAYHLRALAFFDECRIPAQAAGLTHAQPEGA